MLILEFWFFFNRELVEILKGCKNYYREFLIYRYLMNLGLKLIELVY